MAGFASDRPIPEVVNIGIIDASGVIEPTIVLTPRQYPPGVMSTTG